MSPSPALETSIRTWADRLCHAFEDIQRCDVMVALPHRSQRHGNMFQVHVNVTVPGRTIAISRDPGVDHTHENAYVAVADAFRAAHRSLQHRAARASERRGA